MLEFSEGLPGKIQGNCIQGRTLNRDGEIAEEDNSAGDESAEPAGTLLSHKCRVIIVVLLERTAGLSIASQSY